MDDNQEIELHTCAGTYCLYGTKPTRTQIIHIPLTYDRSLRKCETFSYHVSPFARAFRSHSSSTERSSGSVEAGSASAETEAAAAAEDEDEAAAAEGDPPLALAATAAAAAPPPPSATMLMVYSQPLQLFSLTAILSVLLPLFFDLDFPDFFSSSFCTLLFFGCFLASLPRLLLFSSLFSLALFFLLFFLPFLSFLWPPRGE